MFGLKNDWKIRVEVTKEISDDVEYSWAKVFRVEENGTEEEVQPTNLKTFDCDQEGMLEKALQFARSLLFDREEQSDAVLEDCLLLLFLFFKRIIRAKRAN